MTKIIDAVLGTGFVVADWLMFHDIFKVGEQHTFVEYLVGVLSVIVILNSARSFFKTA